MAVCYDKRQTRAIVRSLRFYSPADLPWVEGFLLPALGLPDERVVTTRRFELGTPLVQAFERAVADSRRTVIVLSPAYLSDQWLEFGDQLASHSRVSDRRNRLIPLYLKPCELPLHLDFLVRLDCTEEANWDHEISRLRELLGRPEPPEENIPCPYPGMVPFSEADATRFFGREDEIADLRQRLRHQNLLMVIGPSGCGKSSLVYAGLVPELCRQQPSMWIVRSMRPGSTPMAALQATMDDFAETHTDECIDDTPVSAHAARSAILLIIDQFEEVFAQASNLEQTQFIAALRSLCQSGCMKIVLTMRADFYHDLMLSDLWPLQPSQRLEVAPLKGDPLRRAIERPANNVGVYLETAIIRTFGFRRRL